VADGSAYGACDCGAVQIDEVLGFVGAPCESDADCQGVLGCLTASSNDYFGNGGPAGGYCSLRCTDSAQCQEVDPLSGCATLGGVGLCIRTCLSKDPSPGERKCLDRPDVVCRSVVADGAEQLLVERQEGRCVPRCGSNAECPAGRVCHAQAGFCTDLPPPGGPISAACSDEDECSGRLCDGLSSADVGVCTAPCVLGQLSGCGFAADDPARGAACITSFVQVAGFAEGIGDLGICRELCDVAGDCLRAGEGWICRPLSAAASEYFGRSGACAPGAAP
jgi:hypothetical protein